MSTVERVRPDPRISRRRRAVERARRRRLMMRVAGGLCGALVVWIVLWSPLLKVRDIALEGAAHTGAGDIARVTDLDEGPNLLFVSAAEIAGQVEGLPWVESVQVDRLLPDTVRIRIVERSAELVMTTESGAWLVDDQGHVLAQAKGNEALPTIGAADLGAVEVGERLNRPSLLAGVRAYASMPAELQARVQAVFAPTGERISFSLKGGAVVRYGSAEQMQDKNEVILALLARFSARDGHQLYFDVRVPSNPAVSGATED